MQIVESYNKRVGLQNELLEKENEFDFKEEATNNTKGQRHKS